MLPSPSCPASLLPQHMARPSESMHECPRPAAIVKGSLRKATAGAEGAVDGGDTGTSGRGAGSTGGAVRVPEAGGIAASRPESAVGRIPLSRALGCVVLGSRVPGGVATAPESVAATVLSAARWDRL